MNTLNRLSQPEIETPQTNALLGIPEYQDRQALNIELNADVFEMLTAPAQVSHLVLLSDRQYVDQERQLITKLCDLYGVTPPHNHTNIFSVDLGVFNLRWERHTEYSIYMVYRNGPFDVPFAQTVISLVPDEWLASLPGELLSATHITLDDRSNAKRSLTELASLFITDTIIGSKVAAGSASVWSDNQIHADGFGRILIHDETLRNRQAGRLVQRLLEIETYRLLAMLPVPMIRQMIPQLAHFDQRLAALTASNENQISIEDEQQLLEGLTKLASEIEQISAQTSHRLNSSRVYYDIVKQRIAELREERIEGLQMLQEFIEQHLSSAMGTCELVHSKLETLSLRVARASALLRTRVDVSMEAQIRDLLKSMDRRAHMQLRLQETVEGLSVVVLSYYLLGIVGYGLKAGKAAGMDVNVDLITGLAIPVVVLGVFFVVRGLRRLVGKTQQHK
ncbi:MAG: DUF3422 domain-containing protein [Betaproteobacteria bacterium]|nr:DUF3422 domain-containing protein [Betaproteobacteria bacterium]